MGEKRISLGHGSGGRLSAELIRKFARVFDNPVLNRLEDSAVFAFSGRLAFTTDSFVVSPLFFPGGDIGSLSVTGTINDLACVGADPLYLSMALIIEEGFKHGDLLKIINSAAGIARKSGVKVVTGDVKVVEAGKADGIYITTSGCGLIPEKVRLGRDRIKKGDMVLVNGPLGDHTGAVLLARNQFSFSGKIKSDAAPLNLLANRILSKMKEVHFIRDVTRGGLATILSEVTSGMEWGLEVFERAIPFRREVRGISEILGLDPMYFACEGRMVFFVSEKEGEKILALMRKEPMGKGAVIIGRVVSKPAGRALFHSRISGTRVLEPLSGEQLPRIC